MGKDFGTTNNALWFTKKLECVISNMLYGKCQMHLDGASVEIKV